MSELPEVPAGIITHEGCFQKFTRTFPHFFALSKEKKTTAGENKTKKQKKKTTENVVMINGRSNDGH